MPAPKSEKDKSNPDPKPDAKPTPCIGVTLAMVKIALLSSFTVDLPKDAEIIQVDHVIRAEADASRVPYLRFHCLGVIDQPMVTHRFQLLYHNQNTHQAETYSPKPTETVKCVSILYLGELTVYVLEILLKPEKKEKKDAA